MEEKKELKQAITVKSVPAAEFIEALAHHFKSSNQIPLPDYADIIKSSTAKELAPLDPDWWYIRAASLARKIYLFPGRGVNAYSRVYGARKRFGSMPSHTVRGSRGCLRKIMIQLEDIGYVSKHKKGGRMITQKGQKELDIIAQGLSSKIKSL